MRQKMNNYKKVCTVLIASLLIGSVPSATAYGATNIRLYNYATQKISTYNNKKISYVYNGQELSLGNTPGILSSNEVALGSYVLIFQKGMGLKCTLDKATKKITISDGNTKIVMTVGSKTAYVNGKSVTMNAAPVTYKYVNANKALTLVPTRFVAETLGYTYHWNSATSTVTISKPLKLFYDNQSVNYSGARGMVNMDGKNINVTNMPSIIISNTAMVQAWKVFSQAMGVDYSIDYNTGALIFTKGSITVHMNLGSTIATINGNQVDCGVSPKTVKNLETNKEVVLVPGSFLSKALGYDYSWNDTSKTSVIKTTSSVGVTSGIKPTPTPTPTPSTGGTGSSGSIAEEMSNYFTWTSKEEYLSEIQTATEAFGKSDADKTIVSSGEYMTNVMNIYQEMSSANTFYETFVITLSSPASTITPTKTDNIIQLNFSNAVCSDRYYSLNSQRITNIETKYDSNNALVNFNLVDEGYTYDMKLSEDGLNLYVTIYPNYLTKVTGGKYKNGFEYVSLTGINEIIPSITEDDYYVYLTLQNAATSIGDLQYEVNDVSGMNLVILETLSDNSAHFIIQKPTPGATYNVFQDENVFHIYFENANKTDENAVLTIPLPEGVTASQITDEDRYYDKKIVISMDGNYVNFYNSNPIITSNDSVSGISVEYENGKTNITIKTTKIQGYRIDYNAKQLDVTIANPKQIYNKIVVLDAGHGGKDPGTLKGTVQEKNIVFAILNNYAKSYFDNSDIKVYYSRVNDTRIDLYERAAFADEVQADLFVSLHVNSSTNSNAKGTSVYYCSTNTSKTQSGLDSKKLATYLVNNLSNTLGTKNLGVINGKFVVIRETKVPAVLIELAFLSNTSDYKLLVDNNFQKKSAKTIYDTLVSVFDAYPTGR